MQIQNRLLPEAKLKYSKAVEIAVAMETAIRDASELQSEFNSNPVSHIAKLTEHNKPTPAKPATTPHCYRCGGSTYMTQLLLRGPDLPPPWKTGPYSASLLFQTARQALSSNQHPRDTCC